MELTECFGTKVFSKKVMRQRLPKEVFDTLQRQIASGSRLDEQTAAVVADAMKQWALEQGATHYAHWFQPMTGATAGKLDSFLNPDGEGGAVAEFSAKSLIIGEPDASSFPSGGLRATFEARGYTAWDPTSPAFVKDSTLYIPTAFCAYTGEALDAKTPLLRSMDALSREAVDLLHLMGYTDINRVTPMAGAEQEYFIVDRALFEKRLDLKNCGATLFGAKMAKGQEEEGHYYGQLKLRVKDYMAEVDRRLWELGVPSKTKHNETAPAQHELAAVYESCNLACDHNQLIMEILRTVAKEKGLACLLHEKPFAYMNGSGKHNNYSLLTDTGVNLLSDKGINGDDSVFLVTICALLRGVDNYASLLRLSTASASNDRRLGGNEAPPAIISVFLGDNMVDYLRETAKGRCEAIHHKGESLDLGLSLSPELHRDDCDRNRTSPFAISGNKFEFRMVGSQQSIAFANTVLNTIIADSFNAFAEFFRDYGYTRATLASLVDRVMAEHGRIIFNGNNYSPEWAKEAARRGLPAIGDTVTAAKALSDPSVIGLFAHVGVLSETECASRAAMTLDAYSKSVAVEASTMAEMTRRQLLPAVVSALGRAAKDEKNYYKATGKHQSYIVSLLERLDRSIDAMYSALSALEEAIEAVPASPLEAHAEYMRDTVRPAMDALRAVCDEAETLAEKRLWPVPTYTDLIRRV